MLNRQTLIYLLTGGLCIPFHLVIIAIVWGYTPAYPLLLEDWTVSLPLAESIHSTDFRLWHLLFPPVNGIHIYFFTRAIAALLIVLTGWNLQLHAFGNYLLAVVNLVLIVGLFRRVIGNHGGWIIIAVSVLLLNLQQEINWLSGFHNGWHLNTLFFIAVLHALLNRQTQVAAFFAACASLTIAHGVLTWVVGLGLLRLLGSAKLRDYVIWITGGAATAILFILILFVFSPSGNLAYALNTRQATVMGAGADYPAFILAYIGGLFDVESNLPLRIPVIMACAGLIIGAVNIWQLYPSHRRLVIICGVIVSYVGFAATMTALGRVRYYGTDWSLANQYIGTSALFWIAFIILSIVAMHHARWLRLLNTMMLVAMVYFYTVGYVQTIDHMTQDATLYEATSLCIEYTAQDWDLNGCFARGYTVSAEEARRLEQLGLAGFASR